MKNAIITAKMKKTYSIENQKDAVHVHRPAYINIEKDEEFEITRSEYCLNIKNSKVHVALWLEVYHMHVTVY